MASKASNKGMSMADMKYEPPTTLHVNLQKFPDVDGYDVGDTCTFMVTGKVRSITKNRDYEEMDVEVSKMKSEGEDNADSQD